VQGYLDWVRMIRGSRLKFGHMYQRVVLSMCGLAKVGRKIVKYGIDYETMFQRRYRRRSLCFVVCEDSGIDGIKS
jgi:hypothetical protein